MKTKFREFCFQNNLTAKKVAEITGLSKSSVDAYCQGIRSPSPKSRAILRDKLHINISDYFE
jgi:transcriptional regulator with XRE-family HTH domain